MLATVTESRRLKTTNSLKFGLETLTRRLKNLKIYNITHVWRNDHN